MKGKKRCKILKEIRKTIAEQNEIAYVTSECQHKGDCAGTCPKCEAEVRYLERELEKRRHLGKTVAVAGVAAAVALSATGCAIPTETDGDMNTYQESQTGSEIEMENSLMGDIVDPEWETEITGVIAADAIYDETVTSEEDLSEG